jgi:hypothetical protein
MAPIAIRRAFLIRFDRKRCLDQHQTERDALAVR